ncbi:MAG: hypothetical protein Q7K98_00095 [Candidatus Omnitrophota bacterium]|nr:hypothetical protein [Candidatus Omnitrophota bacterium]
MNASDKFRMQEQFDKFKNQVQSNAQNTMTNSQEIVEDKKIEAGQYQERQEEATEVFDKLAKRSQRSGLSSTMHIYGFPLLIIAVIGIVLLVLWHQNI